MSKNEKSESQQEGTEIGQSEVEQTEVQQEEAQESNLAKVDVITSEKKVTMSAPVKEFDDLKSSFRSMMEAFVNFMEAAGLEIGKDETGTKINTIIYEFGELRKDLQAEVAKMNEASIPRSEFDEYKAATEEKEEKAREDYVPRSEFDEYKAAVEEKEAKASEDYVTRREFERFREAIREVI